MTLGVLDFILLIGSVVASALIGIYFTNKNKSMDSYMYGDKQMSALPVGISLMTSCLSGLTLLGSSAEFYYQGPTYAFVFIPMLLSGPITAFTMLPVFYKMNTLSLYKYLQKRYGPLIKYLVTIVFMVQMIFYNAVVLYLPSMATSNALGISRVYSILVLGSICVLYSALGGLKAIIWSDLFQAISMFASLLVVGVLGTYDAGGIGQVWRLTEENGRDSLYGFFNMDLTTRHTLFGIIVGSTLKHVYVVGVNQIQIQRALSLPSLRQGQMSFIFCSICGSIMILTSTYLGAVLVAAYRSCDPYLAGEIPRRDAILVHYVARRLAVIPGLRGIFVAGIFSATLSTLSSFANSMAALAIEDFIRPLLLVVRGKQSTDSTNTWLAKVLAITFGIICILVAYVIEKANSRMLQMTTTMFGAIGVPFLVSFGLGIYTRFVNTIGIMTGFAVTLSLGAYVTIYQSFFKLGLSPMMRVYYDEQCAKVFNMTMDADGLPGNNHVPDRFDDLNYLNHGQFPFSIDRISYMTLPAVQFVLMIVIAPIVSILTGGWSQEVDNEFLASSSQKEDLKPDGVVALERESSSPKESSFRKFEEPFGESLSGIMTTGSDDRDNSGNKPAPRGDLAGIINKGFDDAGS